jgi:TolB-like protein
VHEIGSVGVTRFFLSSVITLTLLVSCSQSSHHPVDRGIPRSERAGLAVLSFKNITSGDRADRYQPWELGIPSMLMTDVESIGLFNIVSRLRLEDILEEQHLQKSGLTDPETVVKVGRLVAAHYILSGSFAEMNGTLRIESQVFSVESGAQLGAASISGETDQFFQIEKQLVFKISIYLKIMLAEESRERIANNIETMSIDASLSNYAGEMKLSEAAGLLQQGRKREASKLKKLARSNFEKSLTYDPKYQKAKDNLLKLAMAVPLTL